VIDACVHPVVPRPDDLNAYLPREHRLQRLASPLGRLYPFTVDPYLPGSTPTDEPPRPASAGPAPPLIAHAGAGTRLLPGSDPRLMDAHVLEGAGADLAILLPLTRGLVGDPRFEAAIATATNEWLAETWLGDWNAHGRYRGSIRVCPRRPADAVREIERWASHPFFAQVAVPLEAQLTYGEQHYFEVWKAAALHALPVVVHSDHSGGALLPPTPLGYPLYTLEEYSQQPAYAVTHLASLLGNGVFDRLPDLVFVFADGGFDYAQTILWRLDKDWRASRAEVPWMTRAPSEYLRDHVRYVLHQSDCIDDPEQRARFIELNGLERVLLYGSNYPHWDHLDASQLAASLPERLRDPILDGNARALYGLRVPAGIG
jgi:predicted TIM-barrel fold metal-dependent hydrolase